MKKFKLVATAASGIEALVGKELRELGYECEVENGKIYFEGGLEDIARTNTWLRTADRIKIVVAEFEAYTFDELFEKTKAVAWEDLIPMDGEFPVAGRSVKSTLFSVSDCQAITKKAIVDRLSNVYHRSTRLPESGALFPLEVSILKDKVTLTLDTSGSSLFKRGYRIEKGGAPIKENMAAALILLTTWRKDKPFADPMCGSGTIPIEAALIGHNIAPGINRSFVSESWDWFDESVWEEVRQQAESEADYDVELDIVGSDIDGKMIEIAKRNAAEAGVLDSITFKQMQVSDFTSTKEYGVMVTNPPYGQRLGEEEEVRQIYRELGKAFKPLDTWSKYILTSDLTFEKAYGQRATKKRKLYNGAIRTDLFQYWGKRAPRKKREETTD